MKDPCFLEDGAASSLPLPVSTQSTLINQQGTAPILLVYLDSSYNSWIFFRMFLKYYESFECEQMWICVCVCEPTHF
jgi:hypothetical protein